MFHLNASLLDLRDLDSGRIPGVSQSVGASLAEAAGVCLESQGHVVGVQIVVKGYSNNRYSLNWPPITEQSIRAWGDRESATEFGAAGVAILLIEKETGYKVIERSRRGTGFDYWLGDDTDEPLQPKGRLEVSGIRHGKNRDVGARVRQKLGQTDRSDNSTLPAYVIVVEFGGPLAEVREK